MQFDMEKEKEFMKFDPLVKVVKNKLVKIENGLQFNLESLNVVQADAVEGLGCPEDGVVTAVICPWSKIEMEPGAYNEDLLAKLRDYLKMLEENGSFAFVVPEAGKSFDDADQADSFISAMVHTARRIKDAESVVGFSIVSELLEKDAGKALDDNSWTQWFINEMNKKHGHYVYFAENAAVHRFNVQPKTTTNELVLL